jgi:soluble lytic murein transglycosylase-like protein
MTSLVLALVAADVVRLTNGFELRADRHEIRGEEIVLHSAGGAISLARSAVAAIESLPDRPSAPSVEPALPPTPVAEPLADARTLVRQAAIRNGLPPAFVESVAKAESGFDPKALSPKGAIGLMQLMPATAASLRADATNPSENAEAGARLLRNLLLTYQNEPDQVRRALAAYNAGAGAVKKYGGVPPYRETQTYVERVLRHFRTSQATLGGPPPK